MDFGPGTFALGYLAGLLSTLSPCVLPLLPILIATAVSQHRFGPLALAAGLTLSFTLVGVFIATLGARVGLDQALLRQGAALLLIGFGLVLLVPMLQTRFAAATAGLGASGDSLLARLTGAGWRGQFAVGLVLGIVWSPCVGPTLGAASTLASQGRDLGQIAFLMLLFGLGAATPLLVIGTLSREALTRTRGRLLALGQRGRWLLGAALLVVGLAILSGGDKRFEAWAVEHSPAWLTELTTRF
ncbi:MAG: cytochrome c biogenesis CcdA family protein [Pseudomonadota bacterium]